MSNHQDDIPTDYFHRVVSAIEAQASSSERGLSLASRDWRRASAANERLVPIQIVLESMHDDPVESLG